MSTNAQVCEPSCETGADPNANGAAEAGNSSDSGDRAPHPTDPRRWRDGTWRTGDGALTHGARRYELRGVLPEHARRHVDTFHASLLADRGGEGEVSTIEVGYIQRLSQLEGTLELLGDDLAARGAMTERGRPRAAFVAFLRVLDTWDRYAQRLGLARRTKPVPSLREYLDGRERAREPRE